MTGSNGQSLLVVEDAFLIGMQLKRDLERLGYQVLGPVPSVSAAINLINESTPQAAVLDINLGQEDSLPVARKLSDLDVPFLFVTGFEHVSVSSDEFGSCMLLRKPVLLDHLEQAIGDLLAC